MKRLLLRLVVVAVMGAMLLVTAVPAFADTVFDPAGEGAFVQPKFCFHPGGVFDVCRHLVVTPSGNTEGFTTVDNPDRDEAPQVPVSQTDNQINPSDLH